MSAQIGLRLPPRRRRNKRLWGFPGGPGGRYRRWRSPLSLATFTTLVRLLFPFSPPPCPQNSLAHGFPMAAGWAHSRLTSPTRRPIPKVSRRSSRSPQHHRDATISRLASRRSRDRLNSYLSSIRSPPTAGMCMPVRCTFVRYMPMRCTLVRCTPVRYTPMCTPIRYTLSPARCSRCAEFCMRGCKHLEWERERKVFVGEMGEKMGEEWSQIRDPWLVGGDAFPGPR
jgi:hypothetical protein